MKRLSDVIHKLPINERCYVQDEFYVVHGSKFGLNVPLDIFKDSIQKKHNAYGARVHEAKNNKNIDWKGVSHALRAGFQLKEIYETGDLKYPLKDREFLLAVKQGKLDFTTEVAPRLEEVIAEVETLAENSNLPEKVDRKFWDKFIVDVYNGKYQ